MEKKTRLRQYKRTFETLEPGDEIFKVLAWAIVGESHYQGIIKHKVDSIENKNGCITIWICGVRAHIPLNHAKANKAKSRGYSNDMIFLQKKDAIKYYKRIVDKTIRDL